MKRKLMSLLLVGAMAVTMLAGCGAKKEAEADVAGGKLTVWCWDPAFNIFSMEEAAKIYKAAHPDVEVEVIETPWEDVQTKLTTAATSGDLSTLPDIFLMQDNAFQKNVTAYPDAFCDLSDSGIDFSQFATGKAAYSTVDGKNFGVPFDNGTVIGCYRTDLLEQAGLTVADFEDITWTQYIENGKKVLDATGKPLLSVQAGSSDLITMMLQSAGSSLFSEDGKANIANNENVKYIVGLYKELVDTGVLVEVNSWDEYIATIVNGEVAGTINGCWIMASIKSAEDQKGNWAITNMPKLDGIANATNYSNNGGSSWCVTSNCQNKDLAFDFLASTFAGSTELYDNILSCGAISSWAPAGDSDAYAVGDEFFGGDAVSAKIVEYATKVPSNTTNAYYYEARDAVSVACTNIINGADVATELQTAEDTANFAMQ